MLQLLTAAIGTSVDAGISAMAPLLKDELTPPGLRS